MMCRPKIMPSGVRLENFLRFLVQKNIDQNSMPSEARLNFKKKLSYLCVKKCNLGR